ncbi:MAG: sigma 54-interacting transcriptional regulator [Desulfobacterales bacterium]|nr:sigma 54-interacting transcriptional regulator [Desulfobacterales bacterium]
MIEWEVDKNWKTIVNTIQDGLMIINKEGTIVIVNRALESITGYSKDELIGLPCTVLNCDICDVLIEKDTEHWCTLFRTGGLSKKRCTFLRKDNRYIHVLKNATILKDNNDEVIGAVETVTDITGIIEKDIQIAEFQKKLRADDSFHGIIGVSSPIKKVFDLVANAAQSDAPVIIFGESGTGKELVSKAIHELSDNRNKPLIKVNCAALTESLLESELFGHVKGAFTGAYKDRIGRFEMAQDGYIFLDEIGDMPLSIQVKLLRVLEEKIIEKVGDNNPISVNVRIISATNKNLNELIQEGKFREDLYFRINVIPIHLPPLRNRIEDIPLLADNFFHRIKFKSGKNVQGISSEAMDALIKYPWPGNVRELRSAFEFAFVNSDDSFIRCRHLPNHICNFNYSFTSAKKIVSEDYKKNQLIDALKEAKGNQSVAAQILGISRVTVWNHIKKYNIKIKNDDF